MTAVVSDEDVVRRRPADAAAPARILLVDDEPALLSSMRRQLTPHYRVETEERPVVALDRIDDMDDLAVVVSDMRMPGMDGATLLRQVCDRRPDVTRILLTGFAEIDNAIAAINEGRIFRFLSKPVAPDAMRLCLDDAVAQHRLVLAEREVLEQTLRGSIQALIETLSMANPMAFARATRIGERVKALAEQLDAPDRWEIEVAGMLTHVGAVTLPPGTDERLQHGRELTPLQRKQVAQLPEIALSVLEGIPRLDRVRRIIALQRQRHDGRGLVEPDLAGDAIPLGARILSVATAYDRLEAQGRTVSSALRSMRDAEGTYDPAVLDALARVLQAGEAHEIRYLPLARLRTGMVLAKDLSTADGTLLIGRGQQLTPRVLLRIENWAEHRPIAEPVAVLTHATTDKGALP